MSVRGKPAVPDGKHSTADPARAVSHPENAAAGTPARGIGAFLRASLRALICFAIYTVAFLAIPLAVAFALANRFPGVSVQATSAATALSALVTAGIALRVARRWRTPRTLSARWTAVGALTGLLLPAMLTALALALDSMRLERPLSEPALHLALALALLESAAICFSHGALYLRLIFDAAEARAGRSAAYFIACALTVLTAALRGGNAAALLCAAAASAAQCALYERGGLFAPVAMEIAFSAWTSLLFGGLGESFPGVSPVYALYHVSEAWLTGGGAGLAFGWGLALIMAVAAMLLLRRELAALVRRFHHALPRAVGAHKQPPHGGNGRCSA